MKTPTIEEFHSACERLALNLKATADLQQGIAYTREKLAAMENDLHLTRCTRQELEAAINEFLSGPSSAA